MAGCPDFEYIRRKIPIADVARELGMRISGYRAHCWRTEYHRNDDANPSISFRKQQNSGRCFVCDPNTWSNIDLVMRYRSCNLRQAASWIAANFEVPQRPKGAHIKKRQNWFPHFRAGDVDTVVSGYEMYLPHSPGGHACPLQVLLSEVTPTGGFVRSLMPEYQKALRRPGFRQCP